MAYETGSATDIADFMTKLDTFAAANTWVSDQLDTGAGKAAIHKGTVYVSFRWQTGVNTTLGLYHALGFVGTGTDPGNHTDDSGNGAISGTATVIEGERCVNGLGSDAYTAYHFFQNGDSLHIVLEYDSGEYRHFGFGILDKFGDGWTGGEYCYGHFHSTGPVSTSNTLLLDALFNDTTATQERRAATIHATGLPNQTSGSNWLQVWGATTATARPDDRGSNAKDYCLGGMRGGPFARAFGWIPAGAQGGYVPTHPISAWYVDTTTSSPEELVYLGSMPDVVMMNMQNYSAGDEFSMAGATWKVFPAVSKATVGPAVATGNQGIAYKKVV